MKTLNIYTISECAGQHGAQIWEYYYSYKQAQMYPAHPSIDINFIEMDLSNLPVLTSSALNILHVGLPSINVLEQIDHLDFDLILSDNMFEHLGVANSNLLTQLISRDNMFMIVGSFVHCDHRLYDKCITLSEDWLTCRKLYIDPRAFTSYDIQRSRTRRDEFLYIGGELRSYRKFIIELLRNTTIPIMQNTSTVVSTDDTINGTKDDQDFVNACNNLYNVEGVHTYNKFYNEVDLGLPSRPFGKTTISYLMLHEYYEHKCILYSEASFSNNEVFPTEKTWKCVIANTHWIMFAGANAYSLMADYGIRSILELTPDSISFDNILNHTERYNQQIKSINYLNEHPEIFKTPEAIDILKTNYDEFLTGNKFMMPVVSKLDKILEKY